MFDTVIPPQAKADMESAKGLTLAAIVIYGVFGLLFLFIWVVFPSPLFLVFGGIPLLFLILTLATVYTPLSEGRPGSAKGAALALGIISIFVGGIISAILLLIAYSKIQSAHTAIMMYSGPSVSSIRTTRDIPPVERQPAAGEPSSSGQSPRFCPSCGSPISAPARFCTSCGTRIR